MNNLPSRKQWEDMGFTVPAELCSTAAKTPRQCAQDSITSVLSIEPARYRKGHSVIMAQGDGSGFKTALMWAIEKLGGVWVHRSRGYVFPTKKAERVFRILQRYERMNLTKT